jgi:hypothetical protein
VTERDVEKEKGEEVRMEVVAKEAETDAAR